MVLCGLSVNFLNTLLWDLCRSLVFLFSGDEGQHHFVYRSGGAERDEHSLSGPPKTAYCTKSQPLQNHRRSVKLDPCRAILACHPNTISPPHPDCLWIRSSFQHCGLMLLSLLFFVLSTGVLAKMDSCCNNKTWRVSLCFTERSIGTGEHRQQCLWTINNQFARGCDEISCRLKHSLLSFFHRASVTVGQLSLLTSLTSCELHATLKPYCNVLIYPRTECLMAVKDEQTVD